MNKQTTQSIKKTDYKGLIDNKSPHTKIAKLQSSNHNLNQVICGNAIEILKKFNDSFFDLTVFSPPYDDLRDYNGYSFDLQKLGQQLYRVTKDGGIVVMVIQDQTINGHKSLTSFKTIIDWCTSIGFGLFECAIYKKQGKDGAWWKRRLRVDHEYIPIFVKGNKPKYFNKENIKIPSKHGGKNITGGANRNKDGLTVDSVKMTINHLKCPGTILDYANGGDKNPLKRQHPATFPDKIPYDFINLFTKPGDLVLDPMAGSGSTPVVAKALNRNYIAIDVSQKYCDLILRRLESNSTNINPYIKAIKHEENNIKLF